MVELKPDEAEILAEFLERYITEEIQYIDDYQGIAYLSLLVNICEKCKETDDEPCADVRHVVFCKDCRHRDPEDHKCDCGQPERQGCLFSVRDNYWCACGEKREE